MYRGGGVLSDGMEQLLEETLDKVERPLNRTGPNFWFGSAVLGSLQQFGTELW